jgi:hypothetical protein
MRRNRVSEHDNILIEPTPAVVPELHLVDSQPVSDPSEPASPLNAVRSAAGRLGAKRVHELMKLGQEYEREHGLKAGRQRQRQLIQLGRRYELEHGLAAPKPRRRKRGDAWKEFLAALARVVKPAYRPAVEQMVVSLQPPRAMAG